MPTAKFKRDFDYRTSNNSIVAYKAEYEGSIPKAHLAAAEEAGALEVTKAKADGPEPVQS